MFWNALDTENFTFLLAGWAGIVIFSFVWGLCPGRSALAAFVTFENTAPNPLIDTLFPAITSL